MIKSYSVAPIERLPTELIQNIFLFTNMNPNLPRASPILARSLVDHYILWRYCERAFTVSVFNSSAENYRERQDSCQRQKLVFDMRWMTWSVFSSFLTWWKTHSAMPMSKPLQSSQIDEYGSRCRHGSFGRRIVVFCPWVPQVTCPLPNKLLRAPYTADKLAFTRCLLAISNASVDWANKESVRLSTLAKREAILTRNLEAVHLFSRTRRLTKAPNLELVKFAVLEGGCDRSIVFELMTAAREWGLRRWVDVELDAWVAREAARGNPKARWLKLKLEELRYGKYPDPKAGDYVGDCLVVKGSESGSTAVEQMW